MDQIIFLIIAFIVGLIVGRYMMLRILTNSIKSLINEKPTNKEKRYSYEILNFVSDLKDVKEHLTKWKIDTENYLSQFKKNNDNNTSSHTTNNDDFETIKEKYNLMVIERNRINQEKISFISKLKKCNQNLEWYKNKLYEGSKDVDLYKLNERKKEVEIDKSKLSDNKKEFEISNTALCKRIKELEFSNTKLNKHKNEVELYISKLVERNKELEISVSKLSERKKVDNTNKSGPNTRYVIKTQGNDKPETYKNKTFCKIENDTKEFKSIRKIYFSMPDTNGSFQISNGDPSNDGRKYFRIEFVDSSNRGELFYIPSERDQKAINRLEKFLKPVCDIENISNAVTATKIELIQSGKVSLINDNWIIDQNNKIKIKLY